MKKWDDKVDKKIRDSLGDLDFPFDEASWDRMDAKLSQTADKPVGAFWNGKGYVVLILMLFVSVSALYSVSTYYDLFNWDEQQETVQKEEAMDQKNVEDAAPLNKLTENPEKTDAQVSRQSRIPVSKAGKNEVTVNLVNERSQKSITNKEYVDTDNLQTNVAAEKLEATTLFDDQSTHVEKKAAMSTENPQESDFTKDEIDDNSSAIWRDFLYPIQSKTKLRLSDGLFSGAGIDNLSLGNSSYKYVPAAAINAGLTKEEKKQERANGREIRKKLGKSYRKSASIGIGKFSLKPESWGAKLGAGLNFENVGKWYSIGGEKYLPRAEGLAASLYFQYHVKNRLKLQFDLGYSRMRFFSRVFQLEELGAGNRLSGGILSYFFRYDVRSLQIVDFQTAFQYQFKKRGLLELGLAVGKTIPEVVTNSTVSWSPDILKGEPTFNYPDPILKYSFHLIVGYEYNITNRIAVGIRYNIGLTDLTNNNFYDKGRFPNSDFHGASRGQISVKFKLNKIYKEEE